MPGRQTKYVRHPEAGLLRFESDNLYLQSQGLVRVVVYAAGDDETARKITALMS